MITPTLPGTIPGLLRRGSPVIEDDRIAVYLGADHYGYHYVADLTPKRGCGHRIVQGPVDLDLSDPTGRAHAAWWLFTTEYEPGSLSEISALHRAGSGGPMDDNDVELLRVACLEAAGVSRV